MNAAERMMANLALLVEDVIRKNYRNKRLKSCGSGNNTRHSCAFLGGDAGPLLVHVPLRLAQIRLGADFGLEEFLRVLGVEAVQVLLQLVQLPASSRG